MRRALLTVACVALAAACDNDDFASVTVTQQIGDPAAQIDFLAGISVPEGSATSAHLDMHDHDGDGLSGDLRSNDSTILRIVHTPDDVNRFVFLGVRTGTTSVQIIASGQEVRSIPATVVAPPASSLPSPLDSGAPPVEVNDASAPPDAHD